MKKLVLIDGHSILNRAFYGVPDLTNSEGTHTGAVYGFLNIMFRIVDEDKPDNLIVTFDEHAPTFRHLKYSAYKGTRKPMPEELREQVPLIKQMLAAMNVKVVSKEGLEADDLLGTLAKEAEKKGFEVSLVSGDRDLLQIASEHIKIRIPKTKKGGTEIEDYHASDVQALYGLTPDQFIQLKALMGDTADNIPGVPKVGEKTALELMHEYGSIDSIYEHIEEIKKNSIKESLRENRELADLSLFLATIKTDCELDVHPEDAPLPVFYTEEAYTLCRKLELKSFYSKFDKQKAANAAADMEFTVHPLSELNATGLSKVSLSFYPIDDNTFFAAICTDKDVYVSEGKECADLIRILVSNGCCIYTYDLKKLYPYLYDKDDYSISSGEGCKGFCDLMIAEYLLNPLKGSYNIPDASESYLSLLINHYEEVFKKESFASALSSSRERFEAFAAGEAAALYALSDVLMEKLRNEEMDKLFFEMEMPLSFVLFKTEEAGIRADRDALNSYSAELDVTIKQLEQNIWAAAGEEFNINSPKQLGVILFEKMGIQGGKKTKTGYSTAADVLEKLAADHPFVSDILEYRTYTKLKSTYADGLTAFIKEDGRIHTSLNQCVTATGRLSSTEPNLQNIPMRYELGRKIRKVFTPAEGYIFADADYSQIELRILASLAGDENLIEAYRSGDDIHRITASKVFHVPFEDVTDIQRRNAKAVNFGIVYGISTFGLSEGLSISRKEAEGYIKEYFTTYPGIKAYLDGCKAYAKENGYSVTMFGRRRPIPELKSSNFMQRAFGERVAMNAPIQGTAADVIKIAMIRVYDRLVKEGLKSRLILQIHDELLIETSSDEESKVLVILREEMENAADLPVKLIADAHTGKDWYEAK
ncbi:MAG: DNA polymerase I [Lachnospiraceae bacterium]|nr:DNA polymerase I [Lachnospiraceae bacterium]